MTDPFWNATLYDASDSEEYSHSCPMEAVDEYLKFAMDDNTLAELKRVCPVEVVAYKHVMPSHVEVRGLAYALAENVEEDFLEGMYGTPGGGFLYQAGREQLVTEFTTAIHRAIRDHGNLWHCEEVARRSFTYEELIEQFGPDCDDYEESK